MKFTYAYKTSDGIRHEDSMNASSREEVFETLRAKGIKAIKVVAADGSKANGAPPPHRYSRLVFVAVLFAAVSGIVVAWHLGGRVSSRAANNAIAEKNGSTIAVTFLTSFTRRQVIGDTAIIEKGIRTGWADVFWREGDRFLASFAVPGVPAGQRNTSEKEMRQALDGKVEPQPTDSIEVQQIKAMVKGMKEEARRYLAAGGTFVDYGKRLVERQEAEIAIYNRAKAELENTRTTMSQEEFDTLLEERNDELRNLGLRPVVFGE